MCLSFANSRLVLTYAVRGPIISPQPLKFHKSAAKSYFNYFSFNIHGIHSSTCYELCNSRLVLCNTRIELKPSTFRVSQEVQTNSDFYLFVNIHECPSSTFFVSLLNCYEWTLHSRRPLARDRSFYLSIYLS
jgi:hypothetical protein